MVSSWHLFQQSGAQRGRQRQRHERREGNRGDHHRRELAVDVAGGTGEKGQRHKHRNQHHRHANDGAGNLAHGFAGGLARRQPLLAHDALDVLNHDDRIIHDDTDHQHHAKHRQHIDRKAQRQQHTKGTQQRDRHDQCRDDGVAPVLQKQKHHQEHQRHGFQQGDHHLLDGYLDEA